jgi:hypothetical protein
VQQDRSALPVVTSDNGEVLGWLTHRDVLAAYNTRLQHGVQQAETPAGAAVRTPASPPPAIQPSSSTSPPPAVEHSVTRLQDYRLVDLELIDDSPPVGQPVAQVPWPPSSLLIGIRRNGAPFTATDDTRLEQGDRLTLLVPAEHADQVTEHLQQRQRPPPET